MEEYYKALEECIKAAGYEKEVSGQEIYDDISDEIEGKENGMYVFMVKKENDVIFEYHIEIFDDEFNLASIHINDSGNTTIVDM